MKLAQCIFLSRFYACSIHALKRPEWIYCWSCGRSATLTRYPLLNKKQHSTAVSATTLLLLLTHLAALGSSCWARQSNAWCSRALSETIFHTPAAPKLPFPSYSCSPCLKPKECCKACWELSQHIPLIQVVANRAGQSKQEEVLSELQVGGSRSWQWGPPLPPCPLGCLGGWERIRRWSWANCVIRRGMLCCCNDSQARVQSKPAS